MSICSQLSLSRARSCDLAYGPIVIAHDQAILVKPNYDHNFGQILTFLGSPVFTRFADEGQIWCAIGNPQYTLMFQGIGVLL